MRQEPMLVTVLRRLDGEKGNWREVANGSGVPYQTLTKIAGRFHKNPRVSTVQALFDYFSCRPDQSLPTGSAATTH
jgi:hypothetical protein